MQELQKEVRRSDMTARDRELDDLRRAGVKENEQQKSLR